MLKVKQTQGFDWWETLLNIQLDSRRICRIFNLQVRTHKKNGGFNFISSAMETRLGPETRVAVLKKLDKIIKLSSET